MSVGPCYQHAERVASRFIPSITHPTPRSGLEQPQSHGPGQLPLSVVVRDEDRHAEGQRTGDVENVQASRPKRARVPAAQVGDSIEGAPPGEVDQA